MLLEFLCHCLVHGFVCEYSKIHICNIHLSHSLTISVIYWKQRPWIQTYLIYQDTPGKYVTDWPCVEKNHTQDGAVRAILKLPLILHVCFSMLRHVIFIHLTHTHGSMWWLHSASRVKKFSALALRPSVGQNLILVFGLLYACLFFFYSHMVPWCFPSRVQHPCKVEGLKKSLFNLKNGKNWIFHWFYV